MRPSRRFFLHPSSPSAPDLLGKPTYRRTKILVVKIKCCQLDWLRPCSPHCKRAAMAQDKQNVKLQNVDGEKQSKLGHMQTSDAKPRCFLTVALDCVCSIYLYHLSILLILRWISRCFHFFTDDFHCFTHALLPPAWARNVVCRSKPKPSGKSTRLKSWPSQPNQLNQLNL